MIRPPVPVLLFTHAGLGNGILEAARSILGEIEGVDVLVGGCGAVEETEDRFAAWLEDHQGPVLVLTDLGFGSCCQSARRVSRGRENVGVIAGINLPAFLAVFRTGPHEDFPALMAHLAERARQSVEVYRGGSPA